MIRKVRRAAAGLLCVLMLGQTSQGYVLAEEQENIVWEQEESESAQDGETEKEGEVVNEEKDQKVGENKERGEDGNIGGNANIGGNGNIEENGNVEEDKDFGVNEIDGEIEEVKVDGQGKVGLSEDARDESEEESSGKGREREIQESAAREEMDQKGAGAQEVFYLEEEDTGIAAFSLDNSANLPVSCVRYDKFLAADGLTNTASYPNLGTGMKYIVGDENQVDGNGKRRYAYCLQFAKDSPAGGISMRHVGWADKKVAFALYHGAVYYGEPCRLGAYSTGNWQMDYFVTQMAVHVLNNEFTMTALLKGLNRSGATQAEKNLAYDRISKMVTGANDEANYAGFTGNGWMDMSTGIFSLTGYQDTWTLSGGSYISGGAFHPAYMSIHGYDFTEQVTGCEARVPAGVSVRKRSDKTCGDFDLAVMEKQFRQWQLTGKEIPVTVNASIPRFWGGGIYQCGSASNFQNVCFLRWEPSGGNTVLSQTARLHIPKKPRPLVIYKKDAKTGEKLSGAVFSLWGYDGQAYNKKIGTFQDRKDGSYVLEAVDYSATVDGRFLIKEESPPEKYKENYEPINEADEADLRQYGGRTVRMNADGFYSEKVAEPFVFRDEKLIPKANVSIMKYDIDTGKNLLGAEFAVYAWEESNQVYQDRPLRVLVYDERQQRYVTEEPLVKTEDNKGKFLIREIKMPKGYFCGWSTEIQVTEPGTVELELNAPNYPGRNFTFIKTLRRDEIYWEHGNPTFFFRLWGTDLDGNAHEYRTHVEFTEVNTEAQQGEYVTLQAVIRNIPAGKYQAEEMDHVLRYILTGARTDQENVQVTVKSEGTVNGVEKISADVAADLRFGDGSVIFENRKVLHGDLSDNSVVVNHVKVDEGEI